MKDKYFLDTNIILYSFDNNAVHKKKIASDIIQKGLTEATSRVSFQVIQEFINVTTKGKVLDLRPEDIMLYVREILIPQCEIRPTFESLFDAIRLNNQFKYSFYDSMILSAAIDQKCNILYSEDLHHNHKLKDLRIVNPFI